MSEILFELLRLVVLLAVFAVSCYLIPWIRGKIGQDRLDEITRWVNTAVLMAQQVYHAQTGGSKKGYRHRFVKRYPDRQKYQYIG